ncbi:MULTISPECIES: nuclear transport factor 2 family protein [unclassified Micromonospora]|uniref:nuclear transport factor 2 family protein n=1 Tax=unclassified Micromonospora TaxID=2617518 RepID=UPI00104671D6|nr:MULTISPECIES: nuclear transport factor 2 family protein [unclassified Micromonospora]TDB69562.1 ketosteroid isomerase [Micromonospora sp. KC721]TDB76440.1 ketosteroid isomerase [Micromonospora sp. KC723]
MSTTRRTVDELLSRIVAGQDPDRIAEVYAERVDWQVDWPDATHPDVPWIRPRSTRADVADHHRTLAASTVPGQGSATVTNILVDGPHAVVIGETSQTVRRTGKRFRTRFALHLTVEDGLITRHHVYEDSLAVVEACRD